MIEITQYLAKMNIDGGIVMTIHDELIVELATRYSNRNVLRAVKNIMEDHHGIFKEVEKFKVKVEKIPHNGSWDKKEKVKI